MTPHLKRKLENLNSVAGYSDGVLFKISTLYDVYMLKNYDKSEVIDFFNDHEQKLLLWNL